MAGAPATAPQSGEQPVSLGGYSQFRAKLVKTVLRIRPAPVHLRDAQNTFFDIRHQHGVFVDLGLAPVHESKFQLALLFLGGNQVLLQQTPENDYPTALLPPGKLNAVLAAFPALSGVHPVAAGKCSLQQAFDSGRLTQFEEMGLLPPSLPPSVSTAMAFTAAGMAFCGRFSSSPTGWSLHYRGKTNPIKAILPNRQG